MLRRGFFCCGKIKRRWKRKVGEGKYIFFRGERNRERKTRNRVGDGKYVFFCRLIVEEKEENIWRRKICILQRRRITEEEKEEHLQKAGPSGLSFARGWSILISFVRGRSI